MSGALFRGDEDRLIGTACHYQAWTLDGSTFPMLKAEPLSIWLRQGLRDQSCYHLILPSLCFTVYPTLVELLLFPYMLLRAGLDVMEGISECLLLNGVWLVEKRLQKAAREVVQCTVLGFLSSHVPLSFSVLSVSLSPYIYSTPSLNVIF